MLTEREKNVVRWLQRKKVAAMRQITQQFHVSHMTVVRALKKHGYYTSYSDNAAYYTLYDIPQFDDWGLWSFRGIRFSQHGTLKNTLAVLVEQSPAGRTTAELAQRLHGDVPHVLSKLVKEKRITRRTLAGRQVVYLAAQAKQSQQQWQRRQAEAAATPSLGLPHAMSADEVIAILRQIILRPRGNPKQWAELLTNTLPGISEAKVQRLLKHYALEKKRPA